MPYAPPIPSAIQDHPSQPYSPFRAPVPAATMPRSRRRWILPLAIGGIALLAGGIAAFVMLRDDRPARSRDAVIRQTFAALAAGDEKALHELAEPPRTFARVARCDKSSGSHGSKDPWAPVAKAEAENQLAEGGYPRRADREPADVEARWKREVAQLVRRTKGTRLEVVDILTEEPPALGAKPGQRSKKRGRDEDDDDDRFRERGRYGLDDEDDRPDYDRDYRTTTFRKGHAIGRDCYAKTTFRRQEVKVVVDIKEGDRELTERVKLTVQEIDGEWFLVTLPRLGVGIDVVVGDLEAWRDKTCKCTEGACVEDLDEEYGHLSLQLQLGRDAEPVREKRPVMERLQRERRACEATARGGPELARYKELKDQVCGCRDEECAAKLEREMVEVRATVEANVRRSRSSSSYEVTRQVSELALAASACTRKLALSRPRVYSVWPTDGETAGGTVVSIHGSGLRAIPRTVKVWFGDKEATSARIASDGELIAEAPPREVDGPVDVRVVLTPGGTMVVPDRFTYRTPQKRARTKKIRPVPQDQ